MTYADKLFIFDFDGTLADSRTNIANSLNHALREYNFDEIEPTAIHPLIGKLTLDLTFKKFYPDIDDDQLEALLAAFKERQRENAVNELKFFPNVVSTLTELTERGATLAILTSKYASQINFILQGFDLARYFQVVWGEGIIPAHKPDKACVEYIWTQLENRFNTENTVMIGDSSVDVKTALNAGIPMIAVTHGIDTRDTLTEIGAHFLIDDFSQLLDEAFIQRVFGEDV